MAQVTLQNVAQLAGVSSKTVSRVLNNEPNVTPETAEKVRAAVASLHYVPNAAARNLSRGRAMALGMVIGWPVASPFASTLIEATLKECAALGYNLSLFTLGENLVQQVVQAVLSKQVDGLLLDTNSADDPALMEQIEELCVPYVVIHPNGDKPQHVSCVSIDNLESAKRAVEFLISLGHRAIACISYDAGVYHDQRLMGYRQALQDAGLPYREELTYLGTGLPFQYGFNATATLLCENPEITAIFAVSDEIAMGVLVAISNLGLRVPEDISVIGFDDIRYAGMLVPPLTTIHQPIDDIAAIAVRQLIQLCMDKQTAPIYHILPTSVMIRDTCKPPRSNGFVRDHTSMPYNIAG